MAKTKRPKTTVNVAAVKKEAQKLAKEIARSNPTDHVELAPGTVKRESPLEQEMGSARYKQMIHNHNDKNSHILDRLPFTFPRKSVVRANRSDVLLECLECGYESYGSEYAYIKLCPGCAKSCKVINPEAEKRGEDRDFIPGIFATASDILQMKEERSKKNSQ